MMMMMVKMTKVVKVHQMLVIQIKIFFYIKKINPYYYNYVIYFF